MSGMANWKAKIELDIKDLQKQLIDADEKIDKFANEDRKVKLDIDTKTLVSAIQNLEKMLDSLGKGTGDFKQFENLSKELSSIVSEVQSLSKAFGKVDDSGAKTLLSSIQNIDKSLAELSQNILNVNKNMSNMGGNTSGAVKQVENISNAYQDAAKEAEKLADAQSKIGQKTNISLGDSSTTSANTEIKANSEVIASIEKKKQELASYELQLEETRYEIEKLSKAENEAYGFKKAYSNMNDKYINSRKESLYNSIFGTDKSKGQGSMKYQTMNFGGNVEKGYAAWREELERLGYTLSELRKTNIGVEADIIPIDGRAITNAEEFRKVLFGITSVPSDNIKVLNQQISELESKISSLKSEISSLESVSNNPKKDAFPSTGTTASIEKLEQVSNANKEVQKAVETSTLAIKENAKAIDNGELPALDELVKKANEAAYELTKGKDIVSQIGKKQVYKVTETDENGKTMERIVGQFSYVEKSLDGQLKNVLATYDESTGRWNEEVLSLATNFEKVGKEIISLDNKINKLEMHRDKMVSEHPNYDTSADDKLIDVQKSRRFVLEQTLDLYANEKEYVYEIDAFEKRRIENNRTLLALKEQQNNSQKVKTDEKADKQLVKDWEDAIKFNQEYDTALEKTNELLSKLSVPKELESQWLELIDYADKLRTKLANNEIGLSDYKSSIKSKLSEYNSNVGIQQKRDIDEYNSNVKADNAKKLEREKQIWNELTTSLDRYATLQKRIASNNALSTDNEEATKLLEHIHELQRNDILPAEKLTVSNEKLQQINQTVTDLKAKLKESTLDSLQGSIDKYQKIYDQRSTYSSDFTPSEQYTKNLTELNTAIKNLVEYRNALKNVGEVTVEQEAHLKGLVAACEKASDSFKSLSASEKGTSQIGIDKLIQRINKDLDENTNYSKRAKLGLRALRDELESANPRNLKEITSEIINIENAEIRAGRAGKSFFDIFKTKGIYSFIGQMQSYLSMYVGFYGMVNGVKKAVSTITELDTALVDLKKTTAMNENQLENFYYDSNNVAKQMGVTTKEIIDQASAWSRLSYSSKEASTEMAKLSSQFASISPGMDTTTAQEDLVSIMRAYDIDPSDVKSKIMDKINVLGRQFIAQTYSNVWCYQKVA